MNPGLVWLAAPGDARAGARDRERAAALSIPIVASPPRAGFFIARDARGLVLCHASAPGGKAGIRSALSTPNEIADRRAGGRRSPLARAFGLHRRAPMSVLDATAGLGRDAATLAGLGCPLTVIERHRALYALLADATDTIAVSGARPGWWPNWSAPIHADAGRWLGQHAIEARFEAIYIDPMFTSPRRKSAPQKALAWLADLVGDDADAGALVAVARQHATRRVVVKQHARAAPLAPPDLQIRGRAIRFDIYLALA